METDYKLIGLSDIDPEARKIAVLWVEEYVKDEGFALSTKHKLASDIMNYAKSYMNKNFNAECSRRLSESMTFEREQKLIDLFKQAGSRKLTKKERQLEKELRK
jgi:hypothetical protein